MNKKLYKQLLEIKDYLIIDNQKTNENLEILLLRKNELEIIIKKINSLNKIKLHQDKVDSIIISSLITTLAIIYEIITISSDNSINKNNIYTVCTTPIISSFLSYISFFNYSKNIKLIKNNSISKIEKELLDTNNNINNLLNRKTTNNKILNHIETSLSKFNSQKKLTKKKL